MSNKEARRLVLRNELAELERLAPWIESWAEHGVSSDVSLAVQLCVEEVVATSSCTGRPRGAPSRFQSNWIALCGMLVARIEDDGREFDPTQAPPPVMASSLREAKAGELVIHLVRGFANGMDYERRDGRNQLSLQFIEPQVTSHQSASLSGQSGCAVDSSSLRIFPGHAPARGRRPSLRPLCNKDRDPPGGALLVFRVRRKRRHGKLPEPRPLRLVFDLAYPHRSHDGLIPDFDIRIGAKIVHPDPGSSGAPPWSRRGRSHSRF